MEVEACSRLGMTSPTEKGQTDPPVQLGIASNANWLKPLPQKVDEILDQAGAKPPPPPIPKPTPKAEPATPKAPPTPPATPTAAATEIKKKITSRSGAKSKGDPATPRPRGRPPLLDAKGNRLHPPKKRKPPPATPPPPPKSPEPATTPLGPRKAARLARAKQTRGGGSDGEGDSSAPSESSSSEAGHSEASEDEDEDEAKEEASDSDAAASGGDDDSDRPGRASRGGRGSRGRGSRGSRGGGRGGAARLQPVSGEDMGEVAERWMGSRMTDAWVAIFHEQDPNGCPKAVTPRWEEVTVLSPGSVAGDPTLLPQWAVPRQAVVYVKELAPFYPVFAEISLRLAPHTVPGQAPAGAPLDMTVPPLSAAPLPAGGLGWPGPEQKLDGLCATGSLMNAGAAAWSLDFAPVGPETEACHYLAVGVRSCPMHLYTRPCQSPNCIQTPPGCVTILPDHSPPCPHPGLTPAHRRSPRPPRYALGLVHSWGCVWCLRWNPHVHTDSAPEYAKLTPEQQAACLPRLGVLAVSAGDSVRVLSVPHPAHLDQTPGTPVPHIYLHVHCVPHIFVCTVASLALPRGAQCWSLEWAPNLRQASLLLCGTTDGSVSLFDISPGPLGPTSLPASLLSPTSIVSPPGSGLPPAPPVVVALQQMAAYQAQLAAALKALAAANAPAPAGDAADGERRGEMGGGLPTRQIFEHDQRSSSARPPSTIGLPQTQDSFGPTGTDGLPTVAAMPAPPPIAEAPTDPLQLRFPYLLPPPWGPALVGGGAAGLAPGMPLTAAALPAPIYRTGELPPVQRIPAESAYPLRAVCWAEGTDLPLVGSMGHEGCLTVHELSSTPHRFPLGELIPVSPLLLHWVMAGQWPTPDMICASMEDNTVRRLARHTIALRPPCAFMTGHTRATTFFFFCIHPLPPLSAVLLVLER
ncbi:hypothetical protein PAPYR_7686 [Paratrimastix pyriformis]|uniref:Uncharacterized protein n=1 Tax=Paratrimastix pyriformis TaxID=342808 RepID=A0ABQ8UGF4_9EUKA|nr:hypothetical protein PAPYR_7686 [Paratrimastix pyriformis]